jgi:hypothetical protein
MHTLEIPNVSDELMTQMDARTRQLKKSNRVEYVRSLIENDLKRAQQAKATTFHDILAPVHQQVQESGITDTELDALFEETIEKTRRQRRHRTQTP